MSQKEGNGNFDIVFALFRQDDKFLHPQYFIIQALSRRGVECDERQTYVDNSRVLGHGRRLVLFDARMVLDPQVLDIAAPENDVVVNLIGRCYLFFGSTPPALGAERANILERYGRLVRVDLVKNTDISRGDEQGDWGAALNVHQVLTECRFWK